MKIRSFAEARQALAPFMEIQPTRRTTPPQKLVIMRQLLAYLGKPQEQIKAIHIAGTSGKTSTAYYVASLLKQAGKRVGLTISPHTVEMNDRVQIDGAPLSERQFCSELGIFLTIVESSSLRPTYFELLVAFAWWEFVRQRVEYVVVEVGIGGLFDSTNTIMRPDKVAVITDIGLDHIAILGTTLPEIAEQKAGIIQQDNTVFMYEQSSRIMPAIYDRVQLKNANLHMLQDSDALRTNGLPPFQERNGGLALAAVKYLGMRDRFTISKEAVTAAMLTHIPGRMEIFTVGGKTIILDGAHNMQKIAALCTGVLSQYPGKTVAGLVGIVDSREGQPRAHEVLLQMHTICDRIVVTQFSGPQDGPHRGMDVDTLMRIAKQQGIGDVNGVPDPVKAFEVLCASDAEVLVVAGSFYLLNHIRPLVLGFHADSAPS